MRRLRRRASARSRLAVAGSAIILVIAIAVAALHSSGPPPLPLPGLGKPAPPGDPFAYQASREANFVARASAGEANVVFQKSPGGVLATAARVAAYRPLIDAATKGTSVSPNVLEGIVFLESAGDPNALAGPDAADAAGLTQILAQTGSSLLGMTINLQRSRRLTNEIATAAALGESSRVAQLQRQRARIDARFDPARALAATIRYLAIAQRDLGRQDLAVVSYHMGIGNLQNVLHDYNGGQSVPYPQLFFDTAPDNHAGAFALLQGFGDDSSLYYWRILAAENIMALYRSNPASLRTLSALQTARADNAEVLHPPGQTGVFATPGDLGAAYSSRQVLPLPSDPAKLGLAYSPALGALAHRLSQPVALYRGLRPAALDLLIELAARVRTLSHSKAPLIVAQAVTDRSYEHALGAGGGYSLPATGYQFEIERRYASTAQALAFQAMLDRLQALNLIAWVREPTTIDVTVASDAGRAIVNGL
jgi:hypothetical protein